MTKEQNKGFWRVFQIIFPILIVVSGAVFVIFAIIYELIDADSARYLLSAIVQALAALLAIIFAGVAILWGQEETSVPELERLKDRIIECFKGSRDENKVTLTETTQHILKGFQNLDEETKIQLRNSLLALIKLNLIPWGDVPRQIVGRKLASEAIEEIGQSEVINLTTLTVEAHFLTRSEYLSEFFETVSDVLIFSNFWELFNKDQAESLVTKIKTGFLDFVTEGLKVTVLADRLLSKVKRSQRARGPWFKALISLYAVTIAGGMILLSVLKQGVAGLQATWYAAGPLILAICAVALTFYYLARIVSSEKDA